MPRTSSAAKPRPAPSRTLRPGEALSALEQEVIGYFSPWGEVLGVPRSVAQIYGLLYAAVEPMPFEVIRDKLVMSQGSVSQGLKFLRERELVGVVKLAGEKRETYAAVPSLGRFVQAQLKGEVAPRLASGAGRLEKLRALASGDGERTERIERLAGWNRRGSELLPMLLNLMGG